MERITISSPWQRAGCLLALLAGTAVWCSSHAAAQDSPPKPTMEKVDALMSAWAKELHARLAADAGAQALLAKYPLVLLHSRSKYAGGGYHRSTYSFLYGTTDAAEHFNDVQLQFDNGGPQPNSLTINMVTNQHNRLADLGVVDFTKDPDPAKVPAGVGAPNGWSPGPWSAVAGRVYLEEVRDDNGNHFYVVFKVVAVDREGRYLAFFWRKLPGGKVVRRPPAVLKG
jgi:hypothetical protein